MNGELEIGKEAANFATQFIKNNISELANLTEKSYNIAKSELAVRLRLQYTNYFEAVLEKYSKVKTFLFNEEAKKLRDFYVPIGVKVNTTVYEQVTLDSIVAVSNFNVITGSGGSGKSMVMRSLLLDSIDSGNKLPIFFELRELNDSEYDLEKSLCLRLLDNGFQSNETFIDRAFKAGHFAIFLDGFDELAHEKRNVVAKEILSLSTKYKKNLFIVSSRPDQLFCGWQEFREWEIMDLTVDQACELISKLPHDSDMKNRFIEDLRNKLFTEHKSFLSNPLLLTIMWLCYGENAEIPKKKSLFYERAFEALFNKHDAHKGAFLRPRKTSLDIRDFRLVLSAFSLLSLDQNRLEFSSTELLELAENAKQLTGIDFNSTDFFEDATNGVCIFVEEGLTHRYSHRSFQEFFSACFILTRDDSTQGELMRHYSERMDNMLELAFSMDPDACIRNFFIPELESLFKEIGYKKSFTKVVFSKFLEKNFNRVHFHRNDSQTGSDKSYGLSYSVQRNVYLRILEIAVAGGLLDSSIFFKRITDKRIQENKSAIVKEILRNLPTSKQSDGISISDYIENNKIMQQHMSTRDFLFLPDLLALLNLIRSQQAERKKSIKSILGIKK